MMGKSVGRLIGHIISLIIKDDIYEAIELIRKEGFQCHAREILAGAIVHPEMNDDVVAQFVDHYIKNEDLLSYFKGEESCSVLLDFTKELGRTEPTPIFWQKSSETMQLFVCDLLKRDKETKVKTLYSFRNSSEFLLSELAKKELGVSSPEEFNDPFDCLILSSIRQTEQKEDLTYSSFCRMEYPSKPDSHRYFERFKRLRTQIDG